MRWLGKTEKWDNGRRKAGEGEEDSITRQKNSFCTFSLFILLFSFFSFFSFSLFSSPEYFLDTKERDMLSYLAISYLVGIFESR